MLACVCGGFVELGLYALMSMCGPIIGVWWYNLRSNGKMKVEPHKPEECPCSCHCVPQTADKLVNLGDSDE